MIEKMADRMVSCLCKKAEMPEEEREICRMLGSKAHYSTLKNSYFLQ